MMACMMEIESFEILMTKKEFDILELLCRASRARRTVRCVQRTTGLCVTVACVPQFDTMHPRLTLGANFNDGVSAISQNGILTSAESLDWSTVTLRQYLLRTTFAIELVR